MFSAVSAEPNGELAPVVPESRLILALYDSTEYPQGEVIPIARNVEVVFDHLGLLLAYHDVRQGLPSHEEMSRYHGIFSWFTDWRMEDPDVYLKWLLEETRLGRLTVCMNDFGALENDHEQPADQALLAELFAAWGFRYSPVTDHVAQIINETYVEPGMFGFEYPPRFPAASFMQLQVLPDFGVVPLLQVTAAETPDSKGTVAAIHARGGFVFSPFLMMDDGATFRRKWIIDPYKFLARAFRWQTVPRPDQTTLNGARIFYSQVDGDGSVSLCQGKTDTLTVEAAIPFYRALPLPVTLSVVEGEIFNAPLYPWLRSDRRPVAAFRTLYSMDRIAPASHGFTHPLDWGRGITALTLKDVSRPASTAAEIAMVRGSDYPLTSPILTAPKAEWERRETLDAIHYVDTLLPAGKKCRLYLWTGNTEPSEHAIAMLDAAGYLNLNGGDGRFDPEFPSITSLAPATRHAGARTQVHSSMANENIYTDDWTRNFSGFINVMKTLVNTEEPFRLKPIDLYYHFYSFEKPASEAALRKCYDWCMAQDIAPMFAEQFAAWVIDSRKLTLARRGARWEWADAGKCRTLRFDNCQLVPDAASTGIVGWYQDARQNCLYVHLDESGTGSLRLEADPAARPHLKRASGWVNEWRTDADGIRFRFTAYGNAWCEVAGLPPGARYHASIGKALSVVQVNAAGELRLALDGAKFPADVQVRLLPMAP